MPLLSRCESDICINLTRWSMPKQLGFSTCGIYYKRLASLRTNHPVPSSWYQGRSTKYLVPYQVLGTKYWVENKLLYRYIYIEIDRERQSDRDRKREKDTDLERQRGYYCLCSLAGQQTLVISAMAFNHNLTAHAWIGVALVFGTCTARTGKRQKATAYILYRVIYVYPDAR